MRDDAIVIAPFTSRHHGPLGLPCSCLFTAQKVMKHPTYARCRAGVLQREQIRASLGAPVKHAVVFGEVPPASSWLAMVNKVR